MEIYEACVLRVSSPHISHVFGVEGFFSSPFYSRGDLIETLQTKKKHILVSHTTNVYFFVCYFIQTLDT